MMGRWAAAMMLMPGLVLGLGLGLGPAMAQVPPEIAARAAQRFPQPVQVGSLVGRAVLEPIEAQPVLGRVLAVRRRGDGGNDLVIRLGGLLGVGGRTIAVPTEAIGLLGEHVAVLDYTPGQLAAFPPADPSGALPGTDTIRVGLTKPFH